MKLLKAAMINLAPAIMKDDFSEASVLLEEMGAWDADQTRALGYDGDAVLQICYSDTADRLQAKYSRKNAGLILARQAESLIGCAGFCALNEKAGELQKFFVRPTLRNCGAGTALLRCVLSAMAHNGYALVRLETATFMSEAVALYQKRGFVPCPPFRSPMADLGPITLFMERAL